MEDKRSETDKLLLKFPAAMRQKFVEKDITFPDETLFEYKPVLVYRAVERKENDFRNVTNDDFKSYFELGKTPKKSPRGKKVDWEVDPHYYGVSSYIDEKIVKQLMKFPNPNKKMAVGYVVQGGGPQETNLVTKHVCWWLYDTYEVTGFKLKEE